MDDMVDDEEYDRLVRAGFERFWQFAIPTLETTLFGDVCGAGTLGAVNVQSNAPTHRDEGSNQNVNLESLLKTFIKGQNKQIEEFKKTIMTMGTKIETLDLHVRNLTDTNYKLEDLVHLLTLKIDWVQQKLVKEKKVIQHGRPKIKEKFEDQ